MKDGFILKLSERELNMRIKTIELYNFGSYVGENRFNFEAATAHERVVVIGGKNGAGKTTLFTAIQVGLYGNHAFGFKANSKKYLSEIYNLINSQVRIDERESAYLEISFQQIDNTDLFDYRIRRSWTWIQNEILEELSVWRNNIQLEGDELLNFQNYLIHLIPPELLKLYFFDGEKIADSFFSEKEINIRDALMVLSGNDTFDILHEQVKRVLRASEKIDGNIAQEYMDAKNEVETLYHEVSSLQGDIDRWQEKIDELNAEIKRHKNEYINCGGVTLEEWTSLHNQLKIEEEKREKLNLQKKAFATETLPFIMLLDAVKKIPHQLDVEKKYQTHLALRGVLDGQAFIDVLVNALTKIDSIHAKNNANLLHKQITDFLLDKKWDSFVPLFALSNDEEGLVLSIISRIMDFDPTTFAKHQKLINASLNLSKKIRTKLQTSSIEHFGSYIQTLTAMEEDLKIAHIKKDHGHEILLLKQLELEQKEAKLKSLKRTFEDMLKAQSVSTVSGKVLLLLEELQSLLYSDLIKHVEYGLNVKFRELIRKEDFFSKIIIDENFTVHILRDENVGKTDILALLRSNNYTIATNVLGPIAIKKLQDKFKAYTVAELRKAISSSPQERLLLPIEINKNRLSSGEKQIFVMSLYWSMMSQSKSELPFIIDTPFARIDAQHRANITEYFFKKLSGQLIILSTDEEVSSHHLEAMNNQIAHIYMIEYGADKRTYIQKNQYFEV